MTRHGSVLDALLSALRDAGKNNGAVQSAPAAVLWPDESGQWAACLPRLRALGLTVVGLGAYDASSLCGPAIWVKCALAGVLPQVQLGDGLPVVYLPGVSRADLRAIESCPRDLQPLAELQYRGVLWSQVNGRDWTLNAFLASKSGGLGLSVSQDRETQEALLQALRAGVLLERSVDDLRLRAINAEWLQSLLAPNPTRDLLAWMNGLGGAPQDWGPDRWDVFVARCKADFGFNPIGDGTLAAAEHLAKGEGKWAAVWESYQDSATSFPNVLGLLRKVEPPHRGLLDDESILAGYPLFNERREVTLREHLLECTSLGAEDAAKRVLDAEEENALRRGWLWARLGHAPLSIALKHLAVLAIRCKELPVGNLQQLAHTYDATGWEVDRAALCALAAVQTQADVDAVAAALRAIYLPWVVEAALRFQQAVKDQGGLNIGQQPFGSAGADPGVCVVFVDGLRYDVGVRLERLLAPLGSVKRQGHWSCTPSVTASAKPWCSPAAAWVTGTPDDRDFEPRIAADGRALSSPNFKKLLSEKGIQVLEGDQVGDPTGRAWTQAGDLDHYGHEHGIRLARDVTSQLEQIVERVANLHAVGWKRFRIVTDHGWLLIPGGLPKAELPAHQTETKWGRCAVIKDSAHAPDLTFGWDWCKDVQVAYAPGASSFLAGRPYAHGGLSLQECRVPVLTLNTSSAGSTAVEATITAVTWKGLRCNVEVASSALGLRVDIRTKAAVGATSLVASVKPIEGGRASVAVEDDGHVGVSATVVVLDAAGQVVQKTPTTIGG